MRDIPPMLPLILEFVAGLPAEIDRLKDLINHKDLLDLRRAVHQLRGIGGGYGFDAVTDCAGKIEDSINAAAVPRSIHDQVDALIDVMRRCQSGQSGMVVGSGLHNSTGQAAV